MGQLSWLVLVFASGDGCCVGFTAGGAGLFAASSVLLVADGGAVFDWFVFGFAYLSALSSGHATPDADAVRDF